MNFSWVPEGKEETSTSHMLKSTSGLSRMNLLEPVIKLIVRLDKKMTALPYSIVSLNVFSQWVVSLFQVLSISTTDTLNTYKLATEIKYTIRMKWKKFNIWYYILLCVVMRMSFILLWVLSIGILWTISFGKRRQVRRFPSTISLKVSIDL